MSAYLKAGNNKYLMHLLISTDTLPTTIKLSKLNVYTNNKLTNSFDYRNYLTQNAKNIIKEKEQVNYIMNGCSSRTTTRYDVREKQVQVCNKSTCEVEPNFEWNWTRQLLKFIRMC